MFEAAPNQPKQIQEAEQPLSEAEAPQPDAPEAPPVVRQEPEKEKEHALISIRSALKSRKITEGQLMDFWSQTGATDGSFSSLEEVAMSKPQLLEHTVANWKEFPDKLQEAKGKK
jgi:hypothetical protein